MLNEEIVFNRPIEIKELLNSIGNNLIKVVIGLRRSGKSYLLNTLFVKELVTRGYDKERIKEFDLQGEFSHIRSKEALTNELNNFKETVDFFIIDEVQLAQTGYEDSLISFHKMNPKKELFVTGSNSNALSDDIRKAFKEQASVIKIRPIPYKEIKRVIPDYTVDDYLKTGSLPIIVKQPKNERLKQIENLYNDTYLIDIKERVNTHFISDPEKENIVKTILENMSSPISEKSIAKGIIDRRLPNEETKILIQKEVNNFVSVVTSSFLLCDFDNGKKEDESIPKDFRDHDVKKYCFDNGILNYINQATLNKKNACLVENSVYLELLAQDINPKGLCITRPDGKNGEIDFTFEKYGRNIYIQVAYALNFNNEDREIGNLQAMPIDSRKINIFFQDSLLKAYSDVELIDFKEFLESFSF